MATVNIASIYDPLVFARRTKEAQINLNAFVASGIMTNDPTLAAMAAVGGQTGVMTGYAPMVNDEPRYGNDTPGGTVTHKGLTSNEMNYRKYFGNQSWSFMNLANMINLKQGEDAVSAVTSNIGQYWASFTEKRVINSALGVLADSVANHGGDMVVNVATDAAGAVTDAERINAPSVLAAKQTMGDHASKLNAIAMHSVLKTRLQIQNLIDYIPDATGQIMIPTYLGYRVIEDDSMPAVAGTNRITYTCVLFAAGAFGYADVATDNASETARVSDSGNGSGEDILYSRMSGIVQPLGLSFNSSTLSGGISATWADLALESNWDRTWERKNIPMAFLQVND